jgi:hypothetical protein
MTALVWSLGAVLLLGAAAAPLLSGRRRRGSASAAQDRARDLLSRLELALDRPDLTTGQRREAERCRLLAGSALAEAGSAAGGLRAQKWARTGLDALGEP